MNHLKLQVRSLFVYRVLNKAIKDSILVKSFIKETDPSLKGRFRKFYYVEASEIAPGAKVTGV